jgi:phosphoribosyl-dephospho-CoA transferase
VWLWPQWRESLLAPLAFDARPVVEAWLGRGLPAVACRLDGRLPETAVALGIALPAPERRRVSLVVAPEAVAAVAKPIRLAAALPSAPVGWRGTLWDLDADARALGLSLGVYGSLAWQHLSGHTYMTDHSDVDLLVEPRTEAELARALCLLRSRSSLRAPRLDGEILLAGGRGVSWREVLGAPRRVLVKSRASTSLVSLPDALGTPGAIEGTP